MRSARMPPHAFFSHVTAALLLGSPLPMHLERHPDVHIGVPRGHRAPHILGVVGHSFDMLPGDVITHRGLPITSPARTWCDLATMTGKDGSLELGDLVAVGDHLIHWRLPHTTRAELERVAARFAGRRGMNRIREALPLLNDRAESRQESRLRVALVRGRVPAMEANHVLVDTETGTELRTDLCSREYRTVLEYQGDYHRTRAQWRKDMTRRSRLEADGWAVMELNADDLEDPAELVTRVRKLLLRQGWRG